MPARAQVQVQVQVQVQEARVRAREAQDAARVPALVQSRERASVLAQGSVRTRVPEALAQVLPDAAALAQAEEVLALAAQVSGARVLEALASEALASEALASEAAA